MKDGFESLGRVRAQGVALLLVTFVVGALAGMALERVRTTRRPPRPEPGRFIGQPHADFMPPMFQELDLTDQQVQQIRQILEGSRSQMDSVLDLMMPRLHALTDSVRSEIRAVLTPEQADRLDRLMDRTRRRGMPMQGGLPGGRGRGGPPPPQP
jgi:Spy/CpxP family protein refolding chaperone